MSGMLSLRSEVQPSRAPGVTTVDDRQTATDRLYLTFSFSFYIVSASAFTNVSQAGLSCTDSTKLLRE
jgi:hypothetical protein